MKFFGFIGLAILFGIIMDMIDKINNQHKTYEELMKDPAFACDERLQEKLHRRIDKDDCEVL